MNTLLVTSAFVNRVALSALGFEDLLSDLWIARWSFRKRRHFSLSLFSVLLLEAEKVEVKRRGF